MNRIRPLARRAATVAGALAAVTFALALAPSPAIAATKGTTPAGVAWETGGIGDEEIAAMRSRFANYDLWLTTASHPSGAFLAGVHVHVRDAKGELVLNVDLDGPWLLAKLPPGRYEIEATLLAPDTGRMEVHRHTTDISGKGLRQVVLYFATEDEVSPEQAPLPTAPPQK
jgi:hypothetical protein